MENIQKFFKKLTFESCQEKQYGAYNGCVILASTPLARYCLVIFFFTERSIYGFLVSGLLRNIIEQNINHLSKLNL